MMNNFSYSRPRTLADAASQLAKEPAKAEPTPEAAPPDFGLQGAVQALTSHLPGPPRYPAEDEDEEEE